MRLCQIKMTTGPVKGPSRKPASSITLQRKVPHKRFTRTEPNQIKLRVRTGSWYTLVDRAGVDIPPLSPCEYGRSNSNRQILVRGIFTRIHRHHGISHPTVAEFSLALLREYKNKSDLPTGCGDHFDSDLCFIALDVRSKRVELRQQPTARLSKPGEVFGRIALMNKFGGALCRRCRVESKSAVSRRRLQPLLQRSKDRGRARVRGRFGCGGESCFSQKEQSVDASLTIGRHVIVTIERLPNRRNLRSGGGSYSL